MARLPRSLHTVVLLVATVLVGAASSFPHLQTECGYKASGRAFIINGRDATEQDLLEAPWHAGLYRASKGNGSFEQICAGTLVHQRIVVTAAHCFYHSTGLYGTLVEAKDLKVSFGSATNAWSEKPDGNAQHLDVSRIVPHPRYRGMIRSFADDIGLLVLATPVALSEYARPACVPRRGVEGPALMDGSVGKVSGWGATKTKGKDPSPVLQVAELPFIPTDKCFETVPRSFLSSLTNDKFCAGHVNGSSVSHGDSGGGLTFEHDGFWFLMGVVSVGLPDKLTYSAFTNVSFFSDWINDEIDQVDGSLLLSREHEKGDKPPSPAATYVRDSAAKETDDRTDAFDAEYPWATLQGVPSWDGSKTKLLRACNGALVSNRYVLTTAACTSYWEKQPVWVVIGNYDGELDMPPVEVPAEEILVHPEYGPDRGKPRLHNIALIRLAREVTLNALGQPMNLPALPVKSTNDSSVISVRLRTVGQSKTSDNSSDSPKVHRFLTRLPTRVLPLSECGSKYQQSASTHSCVSSASKKKGFGICRMLPGSVLTAGAGEQGRARSELWGILSASQCKKEEQTAVFTLIAPYLPWIRTTTMGKLPANQAGGPRLHSNKYILAGG